MDQELDFDDPETVMREARSRFVEAFPGRVRSITMLCGAMGAPESGGDAVRATARRMTHQMAGIAGTLGFPGVSQKASDLEQLVVASSLGQSSVHVGAISHALAELTASFSVDLQKPEPAWAKAPDRVAGPRVLVVGDDETERSVATTLLRGAGYQVSASDGHDAYTTARIEHPAIILLDAELPGTGANALCRKIKVSPDLADTPVVFMTSRDASSGRSRDTALGADDFLVKPIDQAELILCFSGLLVLRSAAPAEADEGFLTYEAFAFAAQELLRRERVSLRLVRLPKGQEAAAAAVIAGAAAPFPFVAKFGAHHVVSLALGGKEPAMPGTKSLETLLAEADRSNEERT